MVRLSSVFKLTGGASRALLGGDANAISITMAPPVWTAPR
jgi:hypothetical protein